MAKQTTKTKEAPVRDIKPFRLEWFEILFIVFVVLSGLYQVLSH